MTGGGLGVTFGRHPEEGAVQRVSQALCSPRYLDHLMFQSLETIVKRFKSVGAQEN